MTKEQWIEKMGKHNTDKYETFPVPEGMKEGFKLIEPKQENGAGIKPKDTVEEIEVVAERIWPDMTQPSAVMELKAVNNNNIIFHTNYGKTEVLRFTETEVFVYGEKIECPQDIVDGMRTFLKGAGNEAI